MSDIEDEDLDLDDDDEDDADYADGADHADNADHVDGADHEDDVDPTFEFLGDMALIGGDSDVAAFSYVAAEDTTSAALSLLLPASSSQSTQQFSAGSSSAVFAAGAPKPLANYVPSENILWDQSKEKFNSIRDSLVGAKYSKLREAIDAMKHEVGIYYLTDPNQDVLTKRDVVTDIIKYTSTFVNDFQNPLLDKKVVLDRFIFNISSHPWLAGIVSAFLVAAILVMVFLAGPPTAAIAPWAAAKVGTFFTAGSFALGFFAGNGKEFKATKNIEREAQALISNSRQ